MTGETPQGLQVLVGAHDLDAAPARIDVAEIINHPRYNSFTSDNDIALLRLATPATNVTEFPMLADLTDLELPGTMATIIGWGSLNPEESAFPEILQEAEVPIVTRATALATTNYPAGSLTTNMIPAGHAAGGIDSCGGDSGGPLLVRDAETGDWAIVGVTSFGFGDCGDPEVYGIYARVLNYRDWILGYTQPGYLAWELSENVTGGRRDSDNDGIDHATEFRFALSPHLDDAGPIRASAHANMGTNSHLAVAIHRPEQNDGAIYQIGITFDLTNEYFYAQVGTNITSTTPLGNGLEEIFIAYPIPAPPTEPVAFVRVTATPGSSLIITPRELAFASSANHTLTPEDANAGINSKDYLLTNLPIGQVVSLTLRSGDFNTRLVLRNADTDAVIDFSAGNNAGGNDETLSFTPSPGIRYLVRVRGDSATPLGNYRISLYQVDTLLPNLAVPGSTLGTIAVTDPIDPNYPDLTFYYDDYELLLGGNTATIEVNMVSTDLDAFLYIINAETGEVEYQEDDHLGNTDTRLLFAPEPGASYYVRASTSAAEETGNYTLSAKLFAPLPNLTLPQVAAGTLSISDPVDPNFTDTYYADDFRLIGVADNTQITIKMDSTAFDTYLSILDADTGEILAFDDNTDASNAELSFLVTDATNYLVRASSGTIAATGAYTIRVENFIPTPTLTVPDTDTGTLTTTDRRDPNFNDTFYYDDYLITGLSLGQSVTVRLRSSSFDTYLAVLDPIDGSVLFDNDNDDGTNSEVSFTASADGSVLVRASSATIAATGGYTIETRVFTPPPTISRPGTRSGTLSITDKEVLNTTERYYYDDFDLIGYTAGQGIRVTLRPRDLPPI